MFANIRLKIFAALFIVLFLAIFFAFPKDALAITTSYKITDATTIGPPIVPGVGGVLFHKSILLDHRPSKMVLSSDPFGTQSAIVGDTLQVAGVYPAGGIFTFNAHDRFCSPLRSPLPPTDILPFIGTPSEGVYNLLFRYLDWCGGTKQISSLYLVLFDDEPEPSPSPTPTPTPNPIPFLELPWDYESQGKNFEQIVLDPNSWFDHQYPLQNSSCCDSPVLIYTGKTIDKPYHSHNGYDYGFRHGVTLNTPVIAAASGWATFKSWQNSGGAGNMIKIDHGNGFQTWYEHLSGTNLIIHNEEERVYVNEGQKIAEVGMTGNTTGPHIHFSVFKDLDNDGSFEDEIPFGVTDPLGWEGENGQDPWPRDMNGAQSHNLFIGRESPQEENIPVSGGSISNNQVNVEIPQGASGSQLRVKLINGPFEQISNLITSVVPSFFLNAFDDDDQPVTEFSEPVIINYDYSQADLSNINEDSLKLYTFNEQTFNWEELPTTLDKINKTTSAQTPHFSQFALMGEVKDLIPPTTEMTVTGDKGNENWYRSDVSVKLTGEDNEGGIGMQYTLFTTNDNDWFEYTEPIIFNEEGTHRITYQSFDKAENAEERKTLEFYIDKTPPEVHIETSPKYIWPPNGDKVDVTIMGSSSDKYLSSTLFSIKDEYGLIEPEISSFGQIIKLEARRDGSDLDGRVYIIKVLSEDLAGNTTENQFQVVVPHDQRDGEE